MTVPSNLVPTRITDLPVAPAPTASGTIPIVIGGVLYQAVFSDVAGTAEVPASRIIATGTGLTGGGNLTQDRTIAVAPGGIGNTQLDTTGVVAGTYGSATEIPQIVVNAQGRVVGVQLVTPSFAGLVPDSRNLFAGSGLLGGGNLSQDRTFSVDFSNATPQPIGIPSAGVATQPSRDDHVHPPIDLANADQRTGILGRANGGTGENITNLTAGAVWYSDGNNGFLQTLQGTPGYVLKSNGSSAPTWELVSGTGTVASVGLSLPASVFSVSNSPVTFTGTLTGDFINQNANTLFAGPSAGGAATPAFRTLVNADLQHSTTVVGTTTLTLGGTVTTLGGLTTVTVTQNPVNALELAPKQYVDAVAQGLDVKQSCKYATTANLAALSGVRTVDGQSTSTGDRILVKNQTDAEENGIYVADDVDPWVRSTDMDTWSEVPGAFCFVEEGDTLADTAWVCTSNQGGTIGVTAINWSQFAGPGTYTAGTGLTLTGTTFSITNTTVTPAAYGAADKTLTATVNAQGQLTALADTPIAITNSQVSGSAASGNNGDITSLSGITGAIATPTYVDFKNDHVVLPTDSTGRLYYDNSDQFQTFVFQMNGSVVQHVGEEQFFRIKCQGTITKGQVVAFAGTVGASGGLIGAAATGLSALQSNYILGVADESGVNNDWIFVTFFGEVKNLNTTGGAENWVAGDILYYNPLVTGGLTKVKPSTPNPIVEVAAVVYVGTSNGIIFVRPTYGSALGQLNTDVQFTSVTGGDVIVYDSGDLRWENRAQSTLAVGTATNLASGTAGAVPYQTGAGATTFLALGTSGQVITAGASAPEYTNQSSLSVGTATNLASGTAGAVPYQTGAGATTFLSLGTSTYLLRAGASAPEYVDPSTVTVGSATSATTSTTSTNLAGGAAGSIPYQTGAGATAMLATASGVLVGGTTPSYSTSPSLTGTNFTSIPNAALDNSAVTIGTTSISLGASSLTLGGLTSVAVTQDPTNALDLATKQYVDALVVSGIHYHAPVRVESPTNLTATYNNGSSGVGATLTNSGAQAALVIDGVTLSLNDRVLIYTQTDQTQNGIYYVSNVGSVSTNWVLTRATDADSYGLASPDTLGEGSTVFVQEGTTGAGELYTCNTVGVITFGTTNITFVQILSAQIYSAGAGLNLSGTQFSVATNGISDAMLRQSDGLSVIGRSTNSTGNVADITAGTDNQVLRRSGTALGFGAVNLASSDAVTGDLPFSNLAQGSALSVLGVTGNATADLASIAAASDHQVLRRSGTSLAFGAVNLASSSAVTGTLAIANGGTNATATPTAGAVSYGTGTAYAFSLAGSAGEFLVSGGTGSPTWTATISGGTYS